MQNRTGMNQMGNRQDAEISGNWTHAKSTEEFIEPDMQKLSAKSTNKECNRQLTGT